MKLLKNSDLSSQAIKSVIQGSEMSTLTIKLQTQLDEDATETVFDPTMSVLRTDYSKLKEDK